MESQTAAKNFETVDFGDLFYDTKADNDGHFESFFQPSENPFGPGAFGRDNTVMGSVGEKCEVKELYAVKTAICSCCQRWVDKKPGGEGADGGREAREERDTYAIIRKQKGHGGDEEWKTHSIEIMSPQLRACLAKVFDDYPAVDTNAPALSFEAPFVAFCHCWARLTTLRSLDETTTMHLDLLKRTLMPELEAPFRTMQSFNATGYVDFDFLPFVMIPGEALIHSRDGRLSAGVLNRMEVQSTPFSGKYLELEVNVVEWQGTVFGVRNASWTIGHFDGTRPLVDLSVFPLRVHPDKSGVKERLIARGRIAEALQGQHLRYCAGTVQARGFSSNAIRDAFIYDPVSKEPRLVSFSCPLRYPLG
jgi:hypothetical protein